MISRIKTHYGKFKTLFDYERYWEKKVMAAYQKGFEEGYLFKHKLHIVEKGEKDGSK